MLITFSGVDGSGKSTQIDRLQKALEARGERVETFWLRPGYSREMDALRALIRRGAPRALPRDGEARKKAFQTSSVRGTWMAMAFVDTILQYALKLRAKLLSGTTVICDRYLADACLDIEFRFPELWRAGWRHAWSRLDLLCPRADLPVLLMLPHEAMLHRLEIKQEPFPDPAEIRDQRYERYVELSHGNGHFVCDATQSIDDVHAQIMGRLPR